MSQPTTPANPRPAQLAPMRVGRGRVVHLGTLSRLTGPAGEARYVSYCPASGYDGTVTVGQALTESITCRRCLKLCPAEAIERAQQPSRPLAASVVLPHTGLRVPHTRITVRKLRFLETADGEAYSAELLLDGRPIGGVENLGVGGPTIWGPYHRRFGETDMAAFVAACRDANGGTVSEEFVLAELVEEARTAQEVARFLRAGQLPVRALACLVGDDTDVLDTFPIAYVGVPGEWAGRYEKLAVLARGTWPDAYSIEMWTGQEWAPLGAAERR